MRCPQCAARTEVAEKRGFFRDRRCTNALCGREFTTRELIVTSQTRIRLCARRRASQMEPSACLAVKARGEAATICPRPARQKGRGEGPRPAAPGYPCPHSDDLPPGTPGRRNPRPRRRVGVRPLPTRPRAESPRPTLWPPSCLGVGCHR